jgi:hypothetical protein
MADPNKPTGQDDPRNPEKQRDEERKRQHQDPQKFPSRGEHEGATDDEIDKKEDQGQRRAS